MLLVIFIVWTKLWVRVAHRKIRFHIFYIWVWRATLSWRIGGSLVYFTCWFRYWTFSITTVRIYYCYNKLVCVLQGIFCNSFLFVSKNLLVKVQNNESLGRFPRKSTCRLVLQKWHYVITDNNLSTVFKQPSVFSRRLLVFFFVLDPNYLDSSSATHYVQTRVVSR